MTFPAALASTRSTIFASEEETIRNCLLKMKKNGSRAILLTRKKGERELITGIFTESDLLKKIQFLEHPLNWNRPIEALMRTDFKTLPVEKLGEAAAYMTKYDIKSVPIVSGKGPVFRENIWGMVHGSDIVHAYAAEQNILSHRRKITAAVHTGNQRYPHFIGGLLKKQFRAKLIPAESIFKTGLPSRFHLGLDYLFLDVNHFTLETVLGILGEARECQNPPAVIFMLDESHLPHRTLKALQRLGNHRRFGLLLKPINPLEFQLLLERLKPRST